MAYSIRISEEQRKTLLTVLKSAGGETYTSPHPLQYWVDLLEMVPKQEVEHPGSLHGFCL